MTGWNYVGGRVDLLGDVISGIETQRKYKNLGKGKRSGISNGYLVFAVKW
jgi:hypothetical protein